MILLFISCQSPPSSTQEGPTLPLPTPPVVQIIPENPTAADDLHCIIEEEPGVQYQYSWIANNRSIQREGSELRANDTEWNDVWSCIVTPMNRTGSGESARSQVSIVNDCSQPQPYQGDLFLQSQDDLSLFCRYHNSINGDLWIQGGYNLDDLSCLCEVQGDIYLSINPDLAGNQALSNLRFILGDFTIFQTENLSSLQLPLLRQIGDDLQIISSTAQSFSAPILESIQGELYVENNTDLQLLYLPQLNSINSAVSLVNNPMLQTITASLKYLGGDINIQENLSLENLRHRHATKCEDDVL